jgi:hypothetical protein
MALDPQIMMEMTFNIIYLIYIGIIVAFMSKNMNKVDATELGTAKRIRLAFAALFIGDLGHVGTRLIAIFIGDLESNYALLGIGSLFEMIGLIFLFMFYTDAWRVQFNHPPNLIFKVLIGVGFVGLVIFAFPHNQWTAQTAPFEWVIIRTTPWLIQGITLAILIYRDAKVVKDAPLVRIGIFIFVSFFFYMSVYFLFEFPPLIVILMILGTIMYMLWQYTSYKRFFAKRK